MTQLESIEFQIGHKSIHYRQVWRLIASFRPTHIILEQAIKNVETYIILLLARVFRYEVAFWGHGKSFSSSQSQIEGKLKQWLTKRTAWFFAYTQAGFDSVVAGGFPAEKATVLNNSCDTTAIVLARKQWSASTGTWQEVVQTPRLRGIYIGGIDSSKNAGRLPLIARQIAEEIPGFVLDIVGDGPLLESLRAQEDSGSPIKCHGHLVGAAKADLLVRAAVLIIPGPVGLIAIDSLASGTPIVTAIDLLHGPEYEYLLPDCLVTAPTVDAIPAEAVALLADSYRLARLNEACLLRSESYTLEEMVHRFTTGLTAWISRDSHA